MLSLSKHEPAVCPARTCEPASGLTRRVDSSSRFDGRIRAQARPERLEGLYTLPAMAEFCPHGCYWDCEHLEGARVIEDPAEAAERARLRPVTEQDRMKPLQYCGDCGGSFRDAARHGREHARMRQLGWLSHSDSVR